MVDFLPSDITMVCPIPIPMPWHEETLDAVQRSREIQAAKQPHDLGLPWEPRPGHYVWDEAGFINQPSPFQDRVYFILDLKHFLHRTGTLDTLKASMIWLPTWHDARDILDAMGVENGVVAEALQAQPALEHGEELLTLYRLIASHLREQPTPMRVPHPWPQRVTRDRCRASLVTARVGDIQDDAHVYTQAVLCACVAPRYGDAWRQLQGATNRVRSP